MKNAEHEYRRILPSDSYILVRLDGRAFHTYTKGLNQPLDKDLITAMNETAKAICEEVQGVRAAYVQSDEISLLICPWKGDNTPNATVGELWMGGVEAKILSLTASIATARFNQIRAEQGFTKLAHFDSRVWTFDYTQKSEVVEYFTWRGGDAFKNAITMTALTYFSRKELHKRSTADKIEMLMKVGVHYDDIDRGFLYGRFLSRQMREEVVEFTRKDTGEASSVVAQRHFWDIQPFERIVDFWNEQTLPTHPSLRRGIEK